MMIALGMMVGGQRPGLVVVTGTRSQRDRPGAGGVGPPTVSHVLRLPLPVLLLVVLEILARAYGGDPREVGLVPGDRVKQAVFEADFGFPAQFALGLGAVD